MNNQTSLYLAHHGIMGMKWGKRNGPPYPLAPGDHSASEKKANWKQSLKASKVEPSKRPSVAYGSKNQNEDPVEYKAPTEINLSDPSSFGDPEVLRKGVRLNSVSAVFTDSDAYRKTGRWMYLYDPNNAWDSLVYKGPFSMYKAMQGAKFIKEHKYEVVRDLKMPTKEARIAEFKKLPQKELKKDLEHMRDELLKYNYSSEEKREQLRNCDFGKLKSDSDWDLAYEVFSHLMEHSWMRKSSATYAKRMSKKYDAMIDDNNQKIYNLANNPIIIFNAVKALKKIEDEPVSSLTWTEIKSSTELAKKVLSMHGERLKY